MVCVCTLFYRETVVISDSWEKTWVYSEHPDKEFGKFVLSHGKFWNDPENDKGTWKNISIIRDYNLWNIKFCLFMCKEHFLYFSTFFSGIQTSQDARFYAVSKKFTPFSNKEKTLVIQFTVKHEQNIDCGGGYLKVFDCSLDQKNMYGESPYLIMFGKSSYQNCVIDNEFIITITIPSLRVTGYTCVWQVL